MLASAEGAESRARNTIIGDCASFHSHCALSALKNFTPSVPGPLAQAITLRAVGAGNSLVVQLNEFLNA
jgi:hypothetical protein